MGKGAYQRLPFGDAVEFTTLEGQPELLAFEVVADHMLASGAQFTWPDTVTTPVNGAM